MKETETVRKILYYLGGKVTDFTIKDIHYRVFSGSLRKEKRNSDKELNRARSVLETYIRSESNVSPSSLELISACYIWNYFNTHLSNDHHIDGDILIVDLDGHSTTIEYASIRDIQLMPM